MTAPAGGDDDALGFPRICFRSRSSLTRSIHAGSGNIRIFNARDRHCRARSRLMTRRGVDPWSVAHDHAGCLLRDRQKAYYVEMDAGTVADTAGNAFAGIGGPAAWSFTIGPLSYPDDDTDGDGLSNATEQSLGTDPLVADTDADGLNDGQEVSLGHQPASGGYRWRRIQRFHGGSVGIGPA